MIGSPEKREALNVDWNGRTPKRETPASRSGGQPRAIEARRDELPPMHPGGQWHKREGVSERGETRPNHVGTSDGTLE